MPANRMRMLALDDTIELPVETVVNRRARRLTLRIVAGAGSLRLTVPPHVSDAVIVDFLERNRNWAASRIARLPRPVRVADKATIEYLGKTHRILHLDQLRGVVESGVENGQPVLRVPGLPSAIGRRLRDFFIREARTRLDEAVSGHAAALNVRPRAIRIADTASRWGSCSTTRTLSFSWRVVMAPPSVLDYLAAHETAHLREMNHSPRFWALVRQLCPTMEAEKAWLRRNGPALHAVRFD